MLKELKQLDFWEGLLARKTFILISGRAGVGKSLTGNLLVEALKKKGYKSSIRNFADRLKDCAIEYFNWDGDKDIRGRILLQEVGDVGRQYDKDTWVSQLVDNVVDDLRFDIVIATDWRFPNELEYLESNNFQVLTIRVNAPRRESLKGTENYNHISETSLPEMDNDLYDCTIDNDGSIELNYLVENFVELYF